MLDRQRGDVVFECDGCADTLETGTGNFESALNVLRREGWRTRKIEDEWIHLCSECDGKL